MGVIPAGLDVLSSWAAPARLTVYGLVGGSAELGTGAPMRNYIPTSIGSVCRARSFHGPTLSATPQACLTTLHEFRDEVFSKCASIAGRSNWG
jgi:hypothetical protein